MCFSGFLKTKLELLWQPVGLVGASSAWIMKYLSTGVTDFDESFTNLFLSVLSDAVLKFWPNKVGKCPPYVGIFLSRTISSSTQFCEDISYLNFFWNNIFWRKKTWAFRILSQIFRLCISQWAMTQKWEFSSFEIFLNLRQIAVLAPILFIQKQKDGKFWKLYFHL